MKRWINRLREDAEVPDIDHFLDEIIAVCRAHGLSISHDDEHGGFKIEKFDDDLAVWLKNAADNRPEPEPKPEPREPRLGSIERKKLD